MSKTALTMIPEMCLEAWVGGLWRVTVYLRDHVFVMPMVVHT